MTNPGINHQCDIRGCVGVAEHRVFLNGDAGEYVEFCSKHVKKETDPGPSGVCWEYQAGELLVRGAAIGRGEAPTRPPPPRGDIRKPICLVALCDSMANRPISGTAPPEFGHWEVVVCRLVPVEDIRNPGNGDA